MEKKLYFFVVVLFLSGCATKMAYLNTDKKPEEVQKDKALCQAVVDASDFKDSDLKRKKFNQCMKDGGYKIVSEEEAVKIQGFKELWKKSGVDFKAYDAIFINKVDLSQVKVDNANIPDIKVNDEDIKNLGEEMLHRFSETLSGAIPVIKDEKEAAGKKTIQLNLKLNKIFQTNVGVNAALGVAGHFSPVPLPSAPQGTFSFSAEIFDSFSQEKLIIITDECKEDKNASLAGLENFEKWKHSYNIIDYWADHLAALLAKERGQKYKSQLGLKVIDF